MMLPALTMQNKHARYLQGEVKLIAVSNYVAPEYSAKIEEVPSHVLIKYANFFCSGSLISSRIVLTAATCFHRHKHEKVLVKLGTDTLPGFGLILSVIRMKKHEFYGSVSEMNNDIAMLVLEDIVHYSDKVKKTPIADTHQGLVVEPGSRILVYGFGSQSLPVKYGGRLIRSEMIVLDNLVCKKTYGGLITSSNFCAKYSAIDFGLRNWIIWHTNVTENVVRAIFKQNNCYLSLRDNPLSDNGGAAMVNGVMVGLVSYGINNDLPPYIAILTNVTYFFRWIGMNTVRHMRYYCKDMKSTEMDNYEDDDSGTYSS